MVGNKRAKTTLECIMYGPPRGNLLLEGSDLACVEISK
jgi:hypothetical protein